MKLKQLLMFFLFSSLILISGCSSKLTEEQAIKIVKSDVENDGKGNIKIIPVTHKWGEYVVKWERKSNCDNGTVYINDRSGKLNHGIQSIC